MAAGYKMSVKLPVRDLFGDISSEHGNVHFSSSNDEWSTPQDIFESLHKTYNFTLDPCSNGNAKCENHFSIADNGLVRPWAPHTVFMNPPYSQIGKWMAKAWEESTKGAVVVSLIPSRTDTKWWHSYVMQGEIQFIRGRLKFGDAKHGAPFPSAIVVFDHHRAVTTHTKEQA